MPLIFRVLCGSLICTAPGLFDGHLAVSFGYGLALLWQVVVFTPLAPRTAPSRLLLLAYALYGLKVCVFQGLRDRDPAYVAKALEPQRKQQEARTKVPAIGFTAKRLPLVVGVGTLLTTFAFPLHGVVDAARRGTGLPPLATLGGLVALGGWLFQTVADAQKFAFKRAAGADALCRTGLWSLCRHPNYLGEIAFQIGVLLSGLGGALASGSVARIAARGYLSLLAPLTFASIMLAATRSLEERQLKAYGAEVNYREYVRATPRLFIGIATARAAAVRAGQLVRGLRRRASAAEEEEVVMEEEKELSVWAVPSRGLADVPMAAAAEGVLALAEKDETREAIVAAETEEELSEEIWNISAITGLAGVVAVVLGAAGSALFL